MALRSIPDGRPAFSFFLLFFFCFSFSIFLVIVVLFCFSRWRKFFPLTNFFPVALFLFLSTSLRFPDRSAPRGFAIHVFLVIIIMITTIIINNDYDNNNNNNIYYLYCAYSIEIIICASRSCKKPNIKITDRIIYDHMLKTSKPNMLIISVSLRNGVTERRVRQNVHL